MRGYRSSKIISQVDLDMGQAVIKLHLIRLVQKLYTECLKKISHNYLQT